MGREGKYIAQQASGQGVVVEFHHYQHLMHTFPLIFPHLPQSQHALRQMARFCRACVEDRGVLRARNVRYEPQDVGMRGVDCGMPFCTEHPQVVRGRMMNMQLQRKVWTGLGRYRQEASL